MGSVMGTLMAVVERMNVKTCKICFAEEGEEEDTTDSWFHPCRCSGSMKWVHSSCFQKWLLAAPGPQKSQCMTCRYTYQKMLRRKSFRDWEFPRIQISFWNCFEITLDVLSTYRFFRGGIHCLEGKRSIFIQLVHFLFWRYLIMSDKRIDWYHSFFNRILSACYETVILDYDEDNDLNRHRRNVEPNLAVQPANLDVPVAEEAVQGNQADPIAVEENPVEIRPDGNHREDELPVEENFMVAREQERPVEEHPELPENAASEEEYPVVPVENNPVEENLNEEDTDEETLEQDQEEKIPEEENLEEKNQANQLADTQCSTEDHPEEERSAESYAVEKNLEDESEVKQEDIDNVAEDVNQQIGQKIQVHVSSTTEEVHSKEDPHDDELKISKKKRTPAEDDNRVAEDHPDIVFSDDGVDKIQLVNEDNPVVEEGNSAEENVRNQQEARSEADEEKTVSV